MSKKVYIDEEECIGCGSCEEVCPEDFKLNDETDKAKVIEPEGGRPYWRGHGDMPRGVYLLGRLIKLGWNEPRPLKMAEFSKIARIG